MQVPEQVAGRAKSPATAPEAPIRVLHLGYGARGGGVGKIITDVATEMGSGFQCSVVFFGVVPAFSGHVDRLKAAGIPSYDIVKGPGLDMRGFRAIAAIVRHERPDVIISHGGATAAYRPFIWLTGGPWTKWILVDEDFPCFGTRTLKLGIKYTMGAAFANRIVFPTEDALQAAFQACGNTLQWKRCSVIYNGLGLPKLPADSPGSNGVANLTMVGQFSARKDQATLLKAFAIVRKRTDARLWLVGDNIEPALSGLASDLGVERDVVFWGFQGREAVQDLLRKTTVYCFSSRCEGFGIAVAEAMAAGLPVVACNVGGVRNLITDGVSGLLARPHDPDDLARLILRCLEDRALRAKLGQAARARAMAEFSIERCAKAYGDLVRELVAGRCTRDGEQETVSSCQSERLRGTSVGGLAATTSHDSDARERDHA